MRNTTQSLAGTSFFDVTVKTTVNKLALAIGEPDYEDEDPGRDKTNYQWDRETEDGDVFSIYDWKEYRDFSGDEEIEFHIGAFSKSVSVMAKVEIFQELSKLK